MERAIQLAFRMYLTRLINYLSRVVSVAFLFGVVGEKWFVFVSVPDHFHIFSKLSHLLVLCKIKNRTEKEINNEELKPYTKNKFNINTSQNVVAKSEMIGTSGVQELLKAKKQKRETYDFTQ